MKLICLNAWGCRIKEEFFEYIKTHSESTDIFCFQEIASGGEGISEKDEIKKVFPKYIDFDTKESFVGFLLKK